MAFNGYLTPDERTEIAQGIVQIIGYDSAERSMFLSVVPLSIRQLLPGEGAPFTKAVNDIAGIDRWERLADGTVPLLAYLRLAVRLGAGVPALNAAAEALPRVERATTGAPRIDLAQTPEVKERIIGRDDMVPFAFFRRGMQAAGSVVRLEVPRFQDGAPHMTYGSQTRYLGTGWLIGAGLLITNHHVLNARNDGEAAAGEADLRAQAAAAEVRFDYDDKGVAGVVTVLSELVCWDPDLDYAIARVDDQGRRSLSLTAKPVGPVDKDSYLPVNIIQHPDGRPKLFAVRNNLVTAATDRDLRYFTDTDGGSSGSPVFDDDWKVVGLHRGSTVATGVQYQGREVAYVNLGTQIHAILAHLRAHHADIANQVSTA